MKTLSERWLLLLLAAVQFTHIVDFMLMMPLGPQLMRDLHITPKQFSALVATYTISSGVIGLLTAPFIDRFDRRKLLLGAYSGFIIGTLVCAMSHTAGTLLVARAVSGAFGGLSIAMVMSIIGDVIPAERRAAGMGIVMTAFSAAAAIGVPFGLQLAQKFRWETPFFALADPHVPDLEGRDERGVVHEDPDLTVRYPGDDEIHLVVEDHLLRRDDPAEELPATGPIAAFAILGHYFFSASSSPVTPWTSTARSCAT